VLELQEQLAQTEVRLDDLEQEVEQMKAQRPVEMAENLVISELIDEISGNEELINEIANELGRRILTENSSND